MTQNHLQGTDLGHLRAVASVSGIIPPPAILDLEGLCRAFCDSLPESHGIMVEFGAESHDFPNSRGNISYEFNEEPRVVVGGELNHFTALRILFFVAHGVGHFTQLNDDLDNFINANIVTPASSAVGSRRMMELIPFQGSTLHFGEIFTKHERDATRFGWSLIRQFVLGRYSLISAPQLDELLFWYSLYGVVDHNYHRQSIEGPFPSDPSSWSSVFGRHLESTLMPFLLAGWEAGEFTRFSEAILVGTDGWHFRAGMRHGSALSRMCELCREGMLDPFNLRAGSP